MRLGEKTHLILETLLTIVGVFGFGTVLGLAITGLLPISPSTAAKIAFVTFGISVPMLFFVVDWGAVVHKAIRHFRGN